MEIVLLTIPDINQLPDLLRNISMFSIAPVTLLLILQSTWSFAQKGLHAAWNFQETNPLITSKDKLINCQYYSIIIYIPYLIFEWFWQSEHRGFRRLWHTRNTILGERSDAYYQGPLFDSMIVVIRKGLSHKWQQTLLQFWAFISMDKRNESCFNIGCIFTC